MCSEVMSLSICNLYTHIASYMKLCRQVADVLALSTTQVSQYYGDTLPGEALRPKLIHNHNGRCGQVYSIIAT